MRFLHYWLQKGFSLDYLNNLSIYDRYFMSASMVVDYEEKGQAWDALSVL